MCSTCQLCDKPTGGNSDYWRDLPLCYDCESGLREGRYSARCIASEIKSMRLGTLAVDREPLPKYARYFFQGFAPAAYDSAAAAEWKVAEGNEAARAAHNGRQLERQIAAAVADFSPVENSPTLAELTLPPVAVALPASPAKPSLPRKPRQLSYRTRIPARSQPAGDWRENNRRLILAANV